MKRPALRFLGAAGTVTGSKHLVEAAGRRLLLDCGLFQGLKVLRERNWLPALAPAADLDAVVLSHAHIDHSGYLPRLVREGFRGPIYCTPATADLLEVLLLDSAYLQEQDAERANRLGYARHRPALPLYGVADAKEALALRRPRPYGQPFEAAPGIHATLRRAGHILGSATVELALDGRTTLVFSGDLGRWDRPILRDPEPVRRADVLLVESTYGDREHAPDSAAQLARVVNEAAARGGALLIPAFAVGRTQELVWTLRQLEEAGRIPELPVFLDSPMALDVTEIYCRHTDEHDLDMTLLMDAERCPLCCRQYHLARTVEESRALNRVSGPLIIISASGMASGGRILHHLKHRLDDSRTTVLLVGYQAAGTRGRALQDGAASLRIHGDDVPVSARIESLDGLSAHADRNEILRWLRAFEAPPRRTFVVHGEPVASTALREAIRATLGWTDVEVAEDGASVAL